jgi:hypothetical protein
MSDEERDAFVRKVQEMADAAKASHVKVDVDVEDAETEDADSKTE